VRACEIHSRRCHCGQPLTQQPEHVCFTWLYACQPYRLVPSPVRVYHIIPPEGCIISACSFIAYLILACSSLRIPLRSLPSPETTDSPGNVPQAFLRVNQAYPGSLRGWWLTRGISEMPSGLSLRQIRPLPSQIRPLISAPEYSPQL
jgi:hypothetical protein